MKDWLVGAAKGLIVSVVLLGVLIYGVPLVSEVTPAYFLEVGWNFETELNEHNVVSTSDYMVAYERQSAKYRMYAEMFYLEGNIVAGDRASAAWYNLLSVVENKWADEGYKTDETILFKQVDEYKQMIEDVKVKHPDFKSKIVDTILSKIDIPMQYSYT